MTDPLYERVVEESSEGIFVAQDGEILFSNGTLQELTGYTETDLEGIPTTELVAPEYEDRVLTHYSGRIDGSSESIHDEIALETRTGDRVPVDLSISEISTDGDRAVVAYCREKEPQTAAESHQVLEELPQESQIVLHDLQEALFLLDVDADGTVRFQGFTELGELVTSNSTVELQGNTPVEVFGEELGRQLEGKYRECLDRMVPVSYEQKLQLAGEGTQWQTKLIPIVVDDRVERVVGFTRDVTARKQRERELVRYKSIVESMDDVVFVVGNDRQVKYVNPSTANYAGVPAEALENVGIEESARRMTTSEADAQRWLDAFEQALEAGQRDETGLPADDQFPIRVEIELDLPGGTVIADQWISPMYVDGAVSGAFVISRDITERREHEQQLQALTERLELAVDGAGLGIWDWDMTTDEVEFNEQWAEMLGYSLDEIEPHLDAWETRVHPDDIEGAEEALEAHIAGQTEFYDTEHRMRTADGDWKWIRALGKIADRDGDGNPTRAVGIHIDIDERKSFERTLAEERDMFAQGPAVVFKWKTEEGWPVEYVSDNVESVLGYTPTQLESGEVPFEDVLHDEDTDRVAREVRANSDPGTDRFSQDPYRVVTADGDVRWVLDSTKNVREGDEITHRLGYLVDITTRKEREQELKQFRAAVEQTAHSVYITDTDGQIEYVNPAFETQTGYTAQEAIGETPDLLNSGTHDDELFAEMWETILTGDVWEQEVVNERADGSHYYADQTVAPITDETGDVTAFVAVNRDITERKERERELEQHKELIDNIPVGIYRVTPGPAGEFVEVNPAMVDMFDASSRAELREYSVSDIYANPDRRAAFSEAVITDGIARETELQLETLSGETFWGSVTAIKNDSGGEPYFDCVLTNVTERVEFERQLKEQRDSLEILNQVVRHDIRNDLQLVLAYVELLGEHVDDEGQEYVETVLASARNAVDLTQTARDLAEVMLQSDADLTTINLTQTLEEEVTEAQSGHSGCLITRDGPFPTVHVRANGMLQSVFRNLLQNAIQHNDKEVPEINVSLSEQDDDVVVKIADNGPGIPEQRRDDLFGKGEKGLESEGTGIGLYLVETLIDQYDGDVWIEDNQPEGTVFNVKFEKVSGATPHR